MTFDKRSLFGRAEVKFLEDNALGRICTVDRNGYPHCVRVDYLYRQGKIYVGSQTARVWHKNIAASPRVAFEIDMYEPREDGVFDFRGMMIKGEAYLIKHIGTRNKVADLLRKRHPRAPFGENSIITQIIPKKCYKWGPWDKIT